MSVIDPSGTEEITAIRAILGEYLHVQEVYRPAILLVDAAIGPYGFTGFVCHDGPLPESGRGQRRLLLDRFEAMLDALAGAGWQLASYPRLRFDGRVKPLTQTPAGELVFPARQQTETLEAEFELDRPR